MRPSAFLLLVLLAGCAGNQSGARATGGADPARVTAEEIAASGGATAYEVVDRLHRNWFRDQLSGQAVAVYWDNERLPEGAEALRGLPVQDVAELQYLDGRAAAMRWGQEASGGAIIVVRNRH
ncbi:MAG: hypothetical protein ACREL3_00320 [Gemmatimonadales bacterium]